MGKAIKNRKTPATWKSWICTYLLKAHQQVVSFTPLVACPPFIPPACLGPPGHELYTDPEHEWPEPGHWTRTRCVCAGECAAHDFHHHHFPQRSADPWTAIQHSSMLRLGRDHHQSGLPGKNSKALSPSLPPSLHVSDMVHYVCPLSSFSWPMRPVLIDRPWTRRRVGGRAGRSELWFQSHRTTPSAHLLLHRRRSPRQAVDSHR